ncbi:serine/arginine repetitive matrix protein 1-like isoform X16 [Pecten maximus]|uniref:serine/arginine repetitive matrix protein 1-like isoform X16 n=1 Tax=Pecten maximus TaxID=6579 RepID=UPI001458D664|nr:serine/arginine repetitive matrix protein 1-like isoform X16 [Pecten maximus]
MSSAIVGNSYPPNYNTYNSQSAPNHGQNVITTGVLSNSDDRHQQLQEILGSQRQKEYNQFLQKQEGYHDPHPSSRHTGNEQQHYRSSPSQPQSVQKLLEVQKQIESQMKELKNQSGEESENAEDMQDGKNKGIHTQANRLKKLSKRKNEPQRKLLVHQRGLQNPPWAEHFEVEDIKTTEKIGHGDDKSGDLSEEKNLEEQPWYQNHQKNILPIEKEAIKNRHLHEKYEPSQFSQSDRGYSKFNNKNDLQASPGTNRHHCNQTDELKMNGYQAERKTNKYDNGHYEKHSYPTLNHHQNGSFSVQEGRPNGNPESKDQQSNTRESESHLWNNNRRMEYDKSHPRNKRHSQDLSSQDLDKHTRHQVQHREEHPRQQGESRHGEGHMDNGQMAQGQHEDLRKKYIDQKRESQIQSQDKKIYENRSGRGQWDKDQWDKSQWDKGQWGEGQLDNGQLEMGQNKEYHLENLKEEETTEEGKTFDDFMPFGGMLRRRKVDPVILKAEFLKETQKNLIERTMKEQNPSPRRAPTPPNGLDIITQDERTRMAREKQRLYGQELQRQTQEQMLQKIQNNISVIDRRGQQPTGPNQYNHIPPQQHMPPPQQLASPPPRNVAPPHPPPQSSSPPPPQHSQQPQSQMKTPQLPPNQMQNSHREHHQGTPAGYQSPPPRHRSHPTPQRVEQGYYPEFNGKQHSPVESRDGHRPPPHPRRYATPDRPDWARGPPRQNGTPTGRSSHRRDDRQTPSYWNGGIPVKSPATTPSTRTPSTQHSNRTLTPKDTQENMPDIHLESYRKNPISEWRQKERNKEYNAFLNEEDRKAQKKREKLDSMRRQPAVQPKFDHYSNSDNHERHRQNLETERREQYQSFLSQLPQKSVRHIPSGGSSKEVDFENQKAFPMGNDYAVKQKKLKEEWRKSYELQMDKVGQSMQQPANRSKEFWGSNDNPKIYPTSGEYKRRGEKMKEELREEFHSFMDKKKKSEVPRRQGDPSMDEKSMFSDMGKSQEAHKRRMHENAKQDYKNYVDHAFPEGLNRGQPSFAARKQPPDSWYNAQPPTHRHSPPRDYRPEQSNQKSYGNDPYAERLEQARANEAMYRRQDHEMNGQGQRHPPPRQEAPYALH